MQSPVRNLRIKSDKPRWRTGVRLPAGRLYRARGNACGWASAGGRFLCGDNARGEGADPGAYGRGGTQVQAARIEEHLCGPAQEVQRRLRAEPRAVRSAMWLEVKDHSRRKVGQWGPRVRAWRQAARLIHSIPGKGVAWALHREGPIRAGAPGA